RLKPSLVGGLQDPSVEDLRIRLVQAEPIIKDRVVLARRARDEREAPLAEAERREGDCRVSSGRVDDAWRAFRKRDAAVGELRAAVVDRAVVIALVGVDLDRARRHAGGQDRGDLGCVEAGHGSDAQAGLTPAAANASFKAALASLSATWARMALSTRFGLGSRESTPA